MKAAAIVLVVAGLIAPLTSARGNDAPAATLLYLDQQGWGQASREAKAELAADFMRIFCGNPAMPPATLVGCLDRSEGTGAMFARALACVAAVPASQSR